MLSENKPMSRKEIMDDLADRLRLIIAAAESYYTMHNMSCDTIGLSRTRELLSALELSADHAVLYPVSITFENTMMGYENNVLGLEEKGLLPPKFAAQTFQLVQKIRFI